MSESTDKIERDVLLKAPLARVWQAVSNAEEFGNWFGLDLNGKAFIAGQTTSGRITFSGYEHLVCDMVVVAVDPPARFAYRWHPYALDETVDYSQEPMTLVEILLSEEAGGTRLRVVESGFDQVPPERRFEAFRQNTRGWEVQMESIAEYVSKS